MTDRKCSLRIATEKDLDGLYPIYMDKQVNPYLNFEIMEKKDFKNIFQELLQSGELYVYEQAKEIVSTCVVMKQKRRAQHVACLGTLATHPRFQRQGLGSEFMRELIHKLKGEGIKRVDLYVEADNSVGIQFYKKLGFQLEGVLKKFFIRKDEKQYIDEHVMALILE